jgi:hypothetical protein
MMWTALFCGLVIGAAFSLAQLNGWALIPVSTIFSTIVVISGAVSRLKWGTTALNVVAGTTLLQLSFFVSLFLSETQRPVRTRAASPRREELLRAMQSGIGQELRVEFQSPQDVSGQLLLVLKELQARRG